MTQIVKIHFFPSIIFPKIIPFKKRVSNYPNGAAIEFDVNDAAMSSTQFEKMVILQHEIEAQYPEKNNHRVRIRSTLIEYGEQGRFTAMSKTEGLPAGIAAKMVLTGQLTLTGCQLPIHPAIYEPVLEELKKTGISFIEIMIPVNEKAG